MARKLQIVSEGVPLDGDGDDGEVPVADSRVMFAIMQAVAVYKADPKAMDHSQVATLAKKFEQQFYGEVE
jgi:hypothetical protein